MRLCKALSFVILALIPTLVMCACSPYSSGKPDFDAGETLTPADVESILAAISEQEAAVTERYTAATDAEGKTIVYWTPSGKVWHISPECQTLTRSSNISSGNTEDAELAGKTGECSVCGKGASQ